MRCVASCYALVRGAVVRDDLAHQRNDAEGIGVVQGAQRAETGRDVAELEAQEPATWGYRGNLKGLQGLQLQGLGIGTERHPMTRAPPPAALRTRVRATYFPFTWLEHAAGLGERGVNVRHIAQPERDRVPGRQERQR